METGELVFVQIQKSRVSMLIATYAPHRTLFPNAVPPSSVRKQKTTPVLCRLQTLSTETLKLSHSSCRSRIHLDTLHQLVVEFHDFVMVFEQ